MTLNQFGFISATDLTTPPADGAFKTLFFEPNNYENWRKYGREVVAPSGEVVFLSLPEITILFPGELIRTDMTGTYSATGTLASWYTEYHTAEQTTKGRMWVNYYNPVSQVFEKIVAVPQYSPPNGQLGPIIRDFKITLKAIGLTDPNYQGGQPDPPLTGLDQWA